MKIVDSYEINDGRAFSVELAEDRFVDVKVCRDGGPVYVMQNEDGSTVYSDRAYTDKSVAAFYPGFEYDEKAVLRLVKETLKEYGSDCMEDDGSFPLPSVLKGFREDLLSTRANIRGVTYEMGYQGWMSTFDSNLARALLQVPRGKMYVAIQSTQDYTEERFHPTLLRENGLFTGDIQDHFRIVCINEMARIGEELEVVNEWIFDSRSAAIEAAKEEPEWVLVEYVELKLLAAKYLESKVLWPRVEGVVADVLADAENRAAPMGHFVGKEYEL